MKGQMMRVVGQKVATETRPVPFRIGCSHYFGFGVNLVWLHVVEGDFQRQSFSRQNLLVKVRQFQSGKALEGFVGQLSVTLGQSD
jgi:hypothetical protein